MQKSDTLAQIQSSIDYVIDALTLPDYVNPEDVEQQTALVHLELLSSGEQFPSAEEFHRRILNIIRDWLAPVILSHGDRVRLVDCVNQEALERDIPEQRVLRRECVDRMMAALTPRKKYIIEKRYGLTGESIPVGEIAREIGLANGTVKNLERASIRKMRCIALAYEC